MVINHSFYPIKKHNSINIFLVVFSDCPKINNSGPKIVRRKDGFHNWKPFFFHPAFDVLELIDADEIQSSGLVCIRGNQQDNIVLKALPSVGKDFSKNNTGSFLPVKNILYVGLRCRKCQRSICPNHWTKNSTGFTENELINTL